MLYENRMDLFKSAGNVNDAPSGVDNLMRSPSCEQWADAAGGTGSVREGFPLRTASAGLLGFRLRTFFVSSLSNALN